MGYPQVAKSGRIHRVWAQHIQSNFYHPKKGIDRTVNEQPEQVVVVQDEIEPKKITKQQLKSKMMKHDSNDSSDPALQLSYARKQFYTPVQRNDFHKTHRNAMHKITHNLAYETDLY
jgi:hypothetical protein